MLVFLLVLYKDGGPTHTHIRFGVWCVLFGGLGKGTTPGLQSQYASAPGLQSQAASIPGLQSQSASTPLLHSHPASSPSATSRHNPQARSIGTPVLQSPRGQVLHAQPAGAPCAPSTIRKHHCFGCRNRGLPRRILRCNEAKSHGSHSSLD